MKKRFEGPYFGDLYRNYQKRGLSSYLDIYCEDTNFTDETLIDEKDAKDIKELMEMTDTEVHAWFGLMTNMNMLENRGQKDIHYPDQAEWRKINRFWVEKYPDSYTLLEVWVWG